MTELATVDFDKSILDQIALILADGFQVEDLEAAAKLITREAGKLIGLDGPAKMKAAHDAILSVVEQYDNLIPVIGVWMDLPEIDKQESDAVDAILNAGLKAVLQWAYATNKVVGA